MRPQSTQYGLPLFLEDSTGFFSSTFTDLYDRLRISLSPRGSQSLILLRSPGLECLLDLERLTLSYNNGAPIPVDSYLRRVKGSSSRSPSRRFTASDSDTYTWMLTQSNPRDKSTLSWTCTNSQGTTVAEYTNNDQAVTGSQCAAVLTVEEAWSSIVGELLATLVLVRHLAATTKA